MNVDRFVKEREQAWGELGELLDKARGRPDRLGPAGVRRLGSLYRATAADLAVARRQFPTDPATARVEALVGKARLVVYESSGRRRSILRFLADDYWRLILQRPLPLLVAAALLFGPAVVTIVWALQDPGQAGGLVPDAYRSVAEPRPAGQDLGIPADMQAALSGQILTNNIRVTFLAFAGGLFLGIGTAVVLVINGAFLGLLGGLAWEAGNGVPFVELVTPHGVLELSCIVVAGAAGLRLGWALIDPGVRRRADALVDEGRVTVLIIAGTAPWLVLAGLVEGFVTPAGLGLWPAVVVGLALGILYWVLLLWRGTRPFQQSI